MYSIYRLFHALLVGAETIWYGVDSITTIDVFASTFIQACCNWDVHLNVGLPPLL